jgi:hypothetical protein
MIWGGWSKNARWLNLSDPGRIKEGGYSIGNKRQEHTPYYRNSRDGRTPQEWLQEDTTAPGFSTLPGGRFYWGGHWKDRPPPLPAQAIGVPYRLPAGE